MNQLEVHGSNHLGPPEWLLCCLSMLFLSGACFYLYRILFSSRVKAFYGYVDIENEIGHGLCMAGMATMLAPALLPISSTLWGWILAVASAWFLLRAFTWGLKLPHNKIWWDLIHVGMLGLMSAMFFSISFTLLTYLASAFWVFFLSYAIYWAYLSRRGGRSAGFLEFGSDLAHIAMGLSMFVMTVWPAALMPASHHKASNAPAQSTNGVVVITDANFQHEVLDAHQPVLVMVFGGCEKCAAEVPMFEQLATKYAGRVKFVRIKKDDAPAACRQLGVTDCPAFIFLNRGVHTEFLEKHIDESGLSRFIEEVLKK